MTGRRRGVNLQRRRSGGGRLNPAKLKADITALEQEQHPPRARWGGLDLARRPVVALLCVLSGVVLLAAFAPFDCWYLAYVALVPWALASVASPRGGWATLWSYLGGLVFWGLGVYWLTWITLVGYVPLVGHLGAYWLVAGVVLRWCFRRGWPMWATLPVVWVALEYARAYFLSGFPWFYLAHSQYRLTRLVQICDVTGPYGVSFFVAMVNGAVVDVLAWALGLAHGRRLPAGRAGSRRGALVAAGASAAAAALLLGYGSFRLAQNTTRPGPKVGVVQMAFPISLAREGASSQEVFDAHVQNSRPLIGAGCDLLVWPESMLGFPNMDPDFWGKLGARARAGPAQRGRSFTPAQREVIDTYLRNLARLERLLRELGCPLLAGGGMPAPDPLEEGKWLRSNSALLLARDERGRLRLRGRYDKMHLVPFSEYVPFRVRRPAWKRWLHLQLRRFVPEAMPQLVPGGRPVRFEITYGKERSRRARLAVPICYEGTFARVCRRLVMQDGHKRADLLVNISNDGWFIYQRPGRSHASTELDQHLAQYVFRAIENRVPVVRAVNTGISAHIDSDGRILGVLRHGGRRKMVAGTLVAQTLVDERVSIYSLLGDRFAQAVCAAGVVAAAGALGRTRLRKKKGGQE